MSVRSAAAASMEPEPEAAAQDGRYAGLVQVQFGGEGAFEPAMLTLEPGTPSLTFRSEGGDVLRTGSAVGCDVGRPKSAAEGHEFALQLDLAEKDSEGDSQYNLSVADEARREAWEAALGAYAGGEASAPSDFAERRPATGLKSLIADFSEAPVAPTDGDEQDEFDESLATQDTELKVELGSEEEDRLLGVAREKLNGTEHEGKIDDFWLRACLRARKFNPDRAANLYTTYMAWRTEFQIDTLGSASHERVQGWLSLGMVRATGGRDKAGRYIIQGTMRNARPDLYAAEEVMRGVHAVIEGLLRERPDAQAVGVTMVMDMGGVVTLLPPVALPSHPERGISVRRGLGISTRVSPRSWCPQCRRGSRCGWDG